MLPSNKCHINTALESNKHHPQINATTKYIYGCGKTTQTYFHVDMVKVSTPYSVCKEAKLGYGKVIICTQDEHNSRAATKSWVDAKLVRQFSKRYKRCSRRVATLE